MAATKKIGRRPLLNPDLQKRIVDTIAAGNYLETAAGVGGIGVSTLHSWLDKGRTERELADLEGRDPTPDKQPYVDFLEAVEKARASAEARAVLHIQRAASDGTWQAAAWFLERSQPGRWGRRDHLQHSGPTGGPVEVMVSGGELLHKLQQLAEQRGDGGQE